MTPLEIYNQNGLTFKDNQGLEYFLVDGRQKVLLYMT